MRFLIIGGSGFLGGELARQCSAARHEVAATYLTRPGETAGVEWLPLDVRRWAMRGSSVGWVCSKPASVHVQRDAVLGGRAAGGDDPLSWSINARLGAGEAVQGGADFLAHGVTAGVP
ncbi:hypothetical protein Misp02_40930 [Microtetraspora sp. NBRC 16547]|nr:hypothetical protein Misp02_40930 [Microtetraspora sp. NBRC 16547]